MKEINNFSGEYKFLSNFYLHPIVWIGLVFPAAENAFQASKSMDVEVQEEFVNLTPAKAKQRGRQIAIRLNWNELRDDIMLEILRKKFSNSQLRKKLLATGDADLVEGNWWGDEYWGRCNGVGKNMLGVLLMKVRKELRDGRSG